MEKYLSDQAVCEEVPGLTPGLLAQLRFKGRGPKFLKPSPRTVVYRWSDVEAWLNSTEQTSTRVAS